MESCTVQIQFRSPKTLYSIAHESALNAFFRIPIKTSMFFVFFLIMLLLLSLDNNKVRKNQIWEQAKWTNFFDDKHDYQKWYIVQEHAKIHYCQNTWWMLYLAIVYRCIFYASYIESAYEKTRFTQLDNSIVLYHPQ